MDDEHGNVFFFFYRAVRVEPSGRTLNNTHTHKINTTDMHSREIE